MGANIEAKAEYAGASHHWICPACNGNNEARTDPRGSDVECDYCPWEGMVSSV